MAIEEKYAVTGGPRYERISGTSYAGRFSVILRVDSDGPEFVYGLQVDKEGQAVERDGTDETFHLIAKDTITKRTPMAMNLKYGELEAVK